MGNRFVIGDLHAEQANILKFKHNGYPLRPFRCLQDMHDCITVNWNGRVNNKDTVYVLGDVAFKKHGLEILKNMNGRKILVKGNHDIFKLKDYIPYFEDVRAIVVLPNKAILTHIPVHPDCLKRKTWGRNIHGHLHANHIKRWWGGRDSRYINVSCEQVNYTPITIEEALLR